VDSFTQLEENCLEYGGENGTCICSEDPIVHFSEEFSVAIVGQEAVVVGTEAAEVPPGHERRNGIQFADLLMVTTV
jgi:hypothetical protein